MLLDDHILSAFPDYRHSMLKYPRQWAPDFGSRETISDGVLF
ncbi:unnamed protein product, partial [Arctia plantaginis]